MYRTFQATHHGSVPFSTGCSMRSGLKYFTEPVELVAVGQTTMPGSKNKEHTTFVNTLVVMYKGVAYSHPMFNERGLLYVLYTDSGKSGTGCSMDSEALCKHMNISGEV